MVLDIIFWVVVGCVLWWAWLVYRARKADERYRDERHIEMERLDD